MEKNHDLIMEKKIERALKSLKLHQFETTVLDKKEEVIGFLRESITAGAKVAVGGSVTLASCGVIDWLRSGHADFIDRYAENIDVMAAYRAGLSADVFITSSNSVTLDGKLVNTDGTGNRTAAMIFGPKKVYVIVGWNKLVKDVPAAQERIREIAAPMNCERLKRDTPCRDVGSCVDCLRPERICSAQVILERSHTPGRIHIVIVKEDLGY